MLDTPAHLCWEYLHGGLKSEEKAEIRAIVGIVVKNKRLVKQMIFEIAYRIGYAHSQFYRYMSETTYKLQKQWIRNQILFERSKNGT